MRPYYDRDGITIYCGDCREILPDLDPVDLVLTDPPYGISAAKRGTVGSSRLAAVKDYGSASWDDLPIDQDLMLKAVAIGRHAIVFGGNYYAFPATSCWLLWDKDNTGNFADAEMAWTNLPGAVRLFKWRWNGMLKQAPEARFHPTQKPLAVMKWAIGKAPEGESVLDPFMGSGTTLVAARDMGRKAIGIELEEKYCEIAVKRLAQGALF